MPGMTGIELLRKVRSKDICAIFITSHMEYAVDGFQLEAFDYIIKPYREDRITKCIQKISHFMEMKLKASLFDQTLSDDNIQVKWGKEIIYLKIYEIIYLEALKDYTRVITINKDRKIFTVHSNIGQLLTKEEKLKNFIRIHQSFAVNKGYIRSVSAGNLILSNDLKLPIGPSYKQNLENILL